MGGEKCVKMSGAESSLSKWETRVTLLVSETMEKLRWEGFMPKMNKNQHSVLQMIGKPY